MTWVVAWCAYYSVNIQQEIVHGPDSELEAALKLLGEKGYDLDTFHKYMEDNFADLDTLQEHIYDSWGWDMCLSVIKI